MKAKMRIDSPLPAKPLRRKKTWREKLHDAKDLPKVTLVCRSIAGVKPGETMVIPAPIEVDALMRRVARGKLTTIDELRTSLAAKHRANAACPITTGIFAWIAAHAADEASAAGETKITPYWRTLKTKGEINPKYPGGLPALTARLEAEGHVIFQKGKHVYVRDYERALTRFASPKASRTSPARREKSSRDAG